MTHPTICLKPINDLLKERFFVPSYQRGFRWTERQVADLLNDLWEFQLNSENADKKAFYCLQPVVVKKRSDSAWELVDGQQRLTTIFLILTYLKPILEILRKQRFALSFETRPTSEAFLNNIDRALRDENIDYHHISKAYDVIEEWFKGRDGGHQVRFLQTLLNDDQLGKNVKVIWYELPDTEDPVEAFTRLNVGKIPLTNAELIRALFLRSRNFELATIPLHQVKIAQEWDGIEKVLQADAFWYFLYHGRDSLPNRIEYIFQLIRREETGALPDFDDPDITFRFYNDRFNTTEVDTAKEWLRVKQYFMTLEEWFNDRTLYHLIGYLIHEGDDILAIRKAAKNATKNAFQQILKQRIFDRLMGAKIPPAADQKSMSAVVAAKVNDQSYEGDQEKIRSFLFLFNIATLLRNPHSNLRFPFDSYKKEDWDIEHVRSVQSGKPDRQNEQREWLQRALELLDETGEDQTLRGRIEALLATKKLDEVEFDRLYADLRKHFKEADDTDVDNGIGNLALLDATTNRSYKNAVFPVKRRRILGLDRDGAFVPLCTKNVFLKCYSKRITNMMFWSKDDRQAYSDAIVETLADFFLQKAESIA